MQTTILQAFLDWPDHGEDYEHSNSDLNSLEESVKRTQPEVETYVRAHLFNSLDESEEAMVGILKHGIARLGWMLEEGRNEISGVFTKDEFTLMLSCFQGDFMAPADCMNMASTLCHDLGIELDAYGTSPYADLISRLRNLNVSKRAALADALEVAWHSGPPGFKVLRDMNLYFK